MNTVSPSAGLSEVLREIYTRLIRNRFQESIFGDLACRGLGSDLVAVCPNHSGSTQLSLFVDSNRPLWRCVAGCGTGTWLQWLQRRRGLSYWAALEELARAADVRLHEFASFEQWKRAAAQSEILEQVQTFLTAELGTPAASPVREYLASRKTSDSQVRTMGLGAVSDPKRLVEFLDGIPEFENSRWGSTRVSAAGFRAAILDLGTNRVTLPLRDECGMLYTFITRITPNTSPRTVEKYRPLVPSCDERTQLYNLSATSGAHEAILVEGAFDAARATLAGIENVIAANGVNLLPVHIELLKKHSISQITLFPDSDTVGLETAEKNIDALLNAGISCRVAALPGEYKDIDSFMGDLGEIGPTILRQVLANSRSGAKWRATRFAARVREEKLSHDAINDALIRYAGTLPKNEFAAEFLLEVLEQTTLPFAGLEEAIARLGAEKIPLIQRKQYLNAARDAAQALQTGRLEIYEMALEVMKETREKLS